MTKTKKQGNGKLKTVTIPLRSGRHAVGQDLDFRYQNYPGRYWRIPDETPDDPPNHSRLPLKHDISELCHLGFTPEGSFNYSGDKVFSYLLLLDSIWSSIESHDGKFFRRYKEYEGDDNRVSYHDIFHLRQSIVLLKQDVLGVRYPYNLENAEASFSYFNNNLDKNTEELVRKIRLLSRKYKNGGFKIPENLAGGDKK
ncbi:MAG: hypothetical protein AABX29_06955 [Nanoarchaeota archaeon]